MPDLSLMLPVFAVIIFAISFIRGKKMMIPAIIASEFVVSLGAIETLAALGKSGGAIFYLFYTATGLMSILISAFIAIYFAVMSISRSAVVISVLYFLYGCFTFLIVAESIPLNGNYPLELVGLYNHIQFINGSFCVLILTVTGFSVVGGNGKWIGNFFSMRSGNAVGNNSMLCSRKGCDNDSDNEASTCK